MTTPAPKEGDRVRVSFEAVFDFLSVPGRAIVLLEHYDTNAQYLVPLSACTVIPKPLKRGDTVTAADPEPPDRTVLLDADGDVWQRLGTWWHCIRLVTVRSWAGFQSDCTFKVLYVPGDGSVRLVRVGATMSGGLSAGSGTGNPSEPADMVNHPPHYRGHPSGIDCIDFLEHFNFNRGNCMKYIWRAGKKGDEVEDLEKAAWYLNREIAKLKKERGVA